MRRSIWDSKEKMEAEPSLESILSFVEAAPREGGANGVVSTSAASAISGKRRLSDTALSLDAKRPHIGKPFDDWAGVPTPTGSANRSGSASQGAGHNLDPGKQQQHLDLLLASLGTTSAMTSTTTTTTSTSTTTSAANLSAAVEDPVAAFLQTLSETQRQLQQQAAAQGNGSALPMFGQPGGLLGGGVGGPQQQVRQLKPVDIENLFKIFVTRRIATGMSKGAPAAGFLKGGLPQLKQDFWNFVRHLKGKAAQKGMLLSSAPVPGAAAGGGELLQRAGAVAGLLGKGLSLSPLEQAQKELKEKERLADEKLRAVDQLLAEVRARSDKLAEKEMGASASGASSSMSMSEQQSKGIPLKSRADFTSDEDYEAYKSGTGKYSAKDWDSWWTWVADAGAAVNAAGSSGKGFPMSASPSSALSSPATSVASAASSTIGGPQAFLLGSAVPQQVCAVTGAAIPTTTIVQPGPSSGATTSGTTVVQPGALIQHPGAARLSPFGPGKPCFTTAPALPPLAGGKRGFLPHGMVIGGPPWNSTAAGGKFHHVTAGGTTTAKHLHGKAGKGKNAGAAPGIFKGAAPPNANASSCGISLIQRTTSTTSSMGNTISTSGSSSDMQASNSTSSDSVSSESVGTTTIYVPTGGALIAPPPGASSTTESAAHSDNTSSAANPNSGAATNNINTGVRSPNSTTGHGGISGAPTPMTNNKIVSSGPVGLGGSTSQIGTSTAYANYGTPNMITVKGGGKHHILLQQQQSGGGPGTSGGDLIGPGAHPQHIGGKAGVGFSLPQGQSLVLGGQQQHTSTASPPGGFVAASSRGAGAPPSYSAFNNPTGLYSTSPEDLLGTSSTSAGGEQHAVASNGTATTGGTNGPSSSATTVVTTGKGGVGNEQQQQQPTSTYNNKQNNITGTSRSNKGSPVILSSATRDREQNESPLIQAPTTTSIVQHSSTPSPQPGNSTGAMMAPTQQSSSQQMSQSVFQQNNQQHTSSATTAGASSSSSVKNMGAATSSAISSTNNNFVQQINTMQLSSSSSSSTAQVQLVGGEREQLIGPPPGVRAQMMNGMGGGASSSSSVKMMNNAVAGGSGPISATSGSVMGPFGASGPHVQATTGGNNSYIVNAAQAGLPPTFGGGNQHHVVTSQNMHQQHHHLVTTTGAAAGGHPQNMVVHHQLQHPHQGAHQPVAAMQAHQYHGHMQHHSIVIGAPPTSHHQGVTTGSMYNQNITGAGQLIGAPPLLARRSGGASGSAAAGGLTSTNHNEVIVSSTAGIPVSAVPAVPSNSFPADQNPFPDQPALPRRPPLDKKAPAFYGHRSAGTPGPLISLTPGGTGALIPSPGAVVSGSISSTGISTTGASLGGPGAPDLSSSRPQVGPFDAITGDHTSETRTASHGTTGGTGSGGEENGKDEATKFHEILVG
ncbi:unnamed protein product [Amoebophrya sp. A25]|nr:unnamed protein product [Amoebophrya sp. A25]|eukprot:GSA25T00010221001.1